MKQFKLSMVLALMLSALVACGKKDAGTGAADSSAPAATASAGTCELVSTKDNSPLKIKVVDTDTAEAKEFLATCNTGLMAPSLVKNGGTGAFDTKWVYEKNATDKGMFETIAGGTPGTSGGTMFIWHNQLEGHTGDGLSTDDILKAIAYIRTQYKGDGEKAWLK